MLKTILVALESSKPTYRLIETLDNLQITSATKIILCHVMLPQDPEMDIPLDRPHPSEEFLYQETEQQLQLYQAKLPCPSEIQIVNGDPSAEIIRLAHIYHADLIVIGTRGLTGLQRIVQGSVSSQVVADAPCSVLVVKGEE
ncbi:universal stress protein [Coleofasciculus sp. G2-EDA-02]|uniref:universal stress protein n=1 Tax=Coleofasciculus sp. G2-EDA-02 TaxID=3069529 RepID=UPI0033043628